MRLSQKEQAGTRRLSERMDTKCNKTDATDGDPISSGIDARAKRRKSAKAVPRRSPSGPG